MICWICGRSWTWETEQGPVLDMILSSMEMGKLVFPKIKFLITKSEGNDNYIYFLESLESDTRLEKYSS